MTVYKMFILLFILQVNREISGAALEDAGGEREGRFIASFFSLMDSFLPSFEKSKETVYEEKAEYLVGEPGLSEGFYRRSLSQDSSPESSRRMNILTGTSRSKTKALNAEDNTDPYTIFDDNKEVLDQRAVENRTYKKRMKNPVKDAFAKLSAWRERMTDSNVRDYRQKEDGESVEEKREESSEWKDPVKLLKRPVSWSPVRLTDKQFTKKAKFPATPNIYTNSGSVKYSSNNSKKYSDNNNNMYTDSNNNNMYTDSNNNNKYTDSNNNNKYSDNNNKYKNKRRKFKRRPMDTFKIETDNMDDQEIYKNDVSTSRTPEDDFSISMSFIKKEEEKEEKETEVKEVKEEKEEEKEEKEKKEQEQTVFHSSMRFTKKKIQGRKKEAAVKKIKKEKEETKEEEEKEEKEEKVKDEKLYESASNFMKDIFKEKENKKMYASKIKILGAIANSKDTMKTEEVNRSVMKFLGKEEPEVDSKYLEPESRITFEDDFESFKDNFQMVELNKTVTGGEKDSAPVNQVQFMEENLNILRKPAGDAAQTGFMESTQNNQSPVSEMRPMKLIPIQILPGMREGIFPMAPVSMADLTINRQEDIKVMKRPMRIKPKGDQMRIRMKTRPLDDRFATHPTTMFSFTPETQIPFVMSRFTPESETGRKKFMSRFSPRTTPETPVFRFTQEATPATPIARFTPENNLFRPTPNSDLTTASKEQDSIPVINLESMDKMIFNSQSVRDESNTFDMELQKTKDEFEPSNFMGNFMVSPSKQDIETFMGPMTMTETIPHQEVESEGGADLETEDVPGDLSLTPEQTKLLNKMMVSDTLTHHEMDMVREILAEKMKAMQKILDTPDTDNNNNKDNHNTASLRERLPLTSSIPPAETSLAAPQASLTAKSGQGLPLTSFPLVVQFPDTGCPKYCINIKVEVTRLGRSLSTDCRQTPLCNKRRKKRTTLQ